MASSSPCVSTQSQHTQLPIDDGYEINEIDSAEGEEKDNSEVKDSQQIQYDILEEEAKKKYG